MTNQEFLVELEKVASQFVWTLNEETKKQEQPSGRPRLHLQGSLKGSPSAVFDPLRAVCYAHTGKSFEAKSWPAAARALSLPTPDAAQLLAATQDRTWEDKGNGTRQAVAELIALREQMLEATQLQHESSASAGEMSTATGSS